MNRRVPLPPQLADASKLPHERISYYAEADASLLESIECGIVFEIAYWSMYAVRAWPEVTEALARIDPDGRLEIAVVDADGMPQGFGRAQFIGRGMGGAGMLWIRDGRIVAESHSGLRVEEHTRWLLGLPDRLPTVRAFA